MRIIPSRKQWGNWSLPSKLTAIGALFGLISILLYMADKSSDYLELAANSDKQNSSREVLVELALFNSTNVKVAIPSRGDIILWFPNGLDNHLRRLPGKYDLNSPEQNNKGLAIEIDPLDTINVVARLKAEYDIVDILDRGITDLEFIFIRQDFTPVFSSSIPFERQTLESTRWLIDLGKRE